MVAGGGMETLELIRDGEQILVYIVRASLRADRTTFVTHPDANLQLGFVVYPHGGEIAPHVHVPLQRTITGTAELLMVKRGRCLIDIYNDRHDLVTTRELATGDVMLMLGGGHGFRIIEDTVLLEAKQGPYTGLAEKERC
jgi:hypothetical protein